MSIEDSINLSESFKIFRKRKEELKNLVTSYSVDIENLINNPLYGDTSSLEEKSEIINVKSILNNIVL